MNKQAWGIAMLAFASFIWGTSFVAQSVGMDYVGPFTFNAARFFVGAATLLPAILAREAWNRRRQPAIGVSAGGGPLLKAGLSCGAVLFVGAQFQQTGIVYTTVGKAGFITTLYIIMVPLLGLPLGRKVSARLWICAITAIVGMYLLCVSETEALNRGDIYVLLCAFCYSGHILMIDHFSPLVDGLKFSFLQFLTSGALSLIFAFILEKPDISAISEAWAPILFTGAMSCGVGYTLQILGQKNVNPVLASLVMSLESVFAALMGWLLLKEVLSPRETGGCVLIFAAVILAQTPQKTSGNPKGRPDTIV
jgi:drug/metabolite transporter (DMT)-like permease